MLRRPLISAGEVGFFGKIPTKGDFVSVGLPRSFSQPWDAWNRDGLQQCRVRLGDGWQSVFLSRPIWRFILAPGLCGEQGWAGTIASSIDQIGRPYPLTVAKPVPGGVDPANLMAAWASGFERMIDLTLRLQDSDDFALGETAEVTAFIDALPLTETNRPPLEAFLQDGQSIQVGPVPTGRTLAASCAEALQQAGSRCSLFWRLGWGLPAFAVVGCSLPDPRLNATLWEIS